MRGMQLTAPGKNRKAALPLAGEDPSAYRAQLWPQPSVQSDTRTYAYVLGLDFNHQLIIAPGVVHRALHAISSSSRRQRQPTLNG